MQNKALEGYISYALATAHRSVDTSIKARLKKHGVQLEAWRIMECLDTENHLTMGALAKAVLINPPTLSKLVDRMAANLDQRGDQQDMEDQDEVLIGKLDGSEQSVLIDLLSKLSN